MVKPSIPKVPLPSYSGFDISADVGLYCCVAENEVGTVVKVVILVLQSESFACSFLGKNRIWGLCLLSPIWLKDS